MPPLQGQGGSLGHWHPGEGLQGQGSAVALPEAAGQLYQQG